MRNIFKFGIIALVVVIGIGLAGCPTEDDGDSGGGGGGGGGELTITGLANDNGKYAIVAGDDKVGDEYLIGGTFSAENVTGVKIEGGSVKLPVYLFNKDNKTSKGYSGNDKVKINVFIQATATKEAGSWIMGTENPTFSKADVQFTNGKATTSK